MINRAIAPSVLLAISVVLIPTASASVVGTLNLTSGSQGVIVSAGAIDWTPMGTGTGTFDSAFGTNLTYGAGTPLPISAGIGSIMDLVAPTTFPVADFMTFPTIPGLTFMLESLGPSSPNSNCAGVTVIGQSCSINSASPFILTLLADGGTAVTLSARGTVKDGMGGPDSTWVGSFTTQLNKLTPAVIQTDFLTKPGFAITSSYSGSFVATAGSAVPEPSSMALAGLGLLLLSRVRFRRKQA